jgi:hypothetical protein
MAAPYIMELLRITRWHVTERQVNTINLEGSESGAAVFQEVQNIMSERRLLESINSQMGHLLTRL